MDLSLGGSSHRQQLCEAHPSSRIFVILFTCMHDCTAGCIRGPETGMGHFPAAVAAGMGGGGRHAFGTPLRHGRKHENAEESSLSQGVGGLPLHWRKVPRKAGIPSSLSSLSLSLSSHFCLTCVGMCIFVHAFAFLTLVSA